MRDRERRMDGPMDGFTNGQIAQRIDGQCLSYTDVINATGEEDLLSWKKNCHVCRKFQQIWQFLVACTRLDKTLCRSDGPPIRLCHLFLIAYFAVSRLAETSHCLRPVAMYTALLQKHYGRTNKINRCDSRILQRPLRIIYIADHH